MKVRIESDGTACGTNVFNAETGEKLEGLTKVDWSVAVGEVAVAKLEFLLVGVTALGETYRRVADPDASETLVPTSFEHEQQIGASTERTDG